MGKWFFRSCLLAFAPELSDKERLTFRIFTGLAVKSHAFFFLTTVNGEERIGRGWWGGWNQLEKSYMPRLDEKHVSQAQE